MDQENLAMMLIVHAGNAKSLAMQAIACAKKGDLEQAKENLKSSDEAMTNAHKEQTTVLQSSFESEEPTYTSLIMTHAQDHVMNAITIMDMAKEFVELYEIIKQMKERI